MTERDQIAYAFIQYAKQKGLSQLETDRQLKMRLDEYDQQNRQQMPERDQIAYGFIQEAKKQGIKKEDVGIRLQEVLDDYDRQNRSEKDQVAYDFIRAAKQQGMGNQEIGVQLKAKLDEYDRQQREALYNPPKENEKNLGQKTVDFLQKWGGSVSRLGQSLGESFAADEATKMQQESQQRRIAQDELIMQKVKEARQAGNEKEAQRLLGILNDPQYQDNTDYDQQIQDYKLGQQRAIQGGIGTAGSLALSGVGATPGASNAAGTVFEGVGRAALLGAGQGALQGGAMSNADLVNKEEYDQLGQDVGSGAAIGAVTGAAIKLGGNIAKKAFSKVSPKISEKVQEFKDKRQEKAQGSDKIFNAESFDDFKKQNQAQDLTRGTAKTPETVDVVQDVVEENVVDAQPLAYDNLTKNEKKAVARKVTRFMNNNNMSVSRQKGYQLNPNETLGEIDEQLKDIGLDISKIDMEDLSEISNKITGDQGATTKATREIIAKTNQPISRTVTIDGEQVDPVIDAVKGQISTSPHLKADDKFKKATIEIVQKTLDDAIDGDDLNRYAPDKLYDALRALQGFEADAKISANRSIMPNASDMEAAKVYQAAAKEVENMINKATLENGVFPQERDALATYYRKYGMNRLADQVAKTENLAQLRSTAKVWTRYNFMHQDALAQMFSTMNRNTQTGNDLINGIIRMLPGGSKLRGAAQVANALTGDSLSNAAGNLIEDLAR